VWEEGNPTSPSLPSNLKLVIEKENTLFSYLHSARLKKAKATKKSPEGFHLVLMRPYGGGAVISMVRALMICLLYGGNTS